MQRFELAENALLQILHFLLFCQFSGMCILIIWSNVCFRAGDGCSICLVACILSIVRLPDISTRYPPLDFQRLFVWHSTSNFLIACLLSKNLLKKSYEDEKEVMKEEWWQQQRRKSCWQYNSADCSLFWGLFTFSELFVNIILKLKVIGNLARESAESGLTVAK